MKKLLLALLWICCSNPLLFSQTCASPVNIALCPVAPASPTSPVFDSRDLSAMGVGETVTDYNDGTMPVMPVASLGKEIFYKLTVTGAGTNPVPTRIDVYVFSNSAQIRIIRLAADPVSCSSTMVFEKSENVATAPCPQDFATYSFPIAGAGDYYFAIEGVTGATYEIAFGAVTGSTTSMVTYPMTMGVTGCAKGVWESSGLKADDMTDCGFIPFASYAPVFELCLNGTVINTDDPLTYVLSGFVNRLCIRTYFRNTMGAEGVKAIEFNFGPSLTATPVPNDCAQGTGSDIPSLGTQGPMNGGADNWIVRYPNVSPSQIITDYNAATPGTANDINIGLNKRIDWLFWDGQAYNTRGDASGCTSTGDCLMYEFCFDIVSIDNLPENTKLVGVFYPDGYHINDVPASPGGMFTITETHSCGLASDGCYCNDPEACFGNGMGSAIDGNGSANPTPPAWIVFDDPAFPDALPVELINLKAESKKDNSIRITWSTASETNSDYFELQRSSTGEKWDALTKLKAAGNSATTEEYGYTDERLKSGIYYYRLKQVDFDGAFEYSKTVSATIGNPSLQTKIFPNPSGTNFNVSISTKHEGAYNIEVYNLANKLVMSRKVDAKAGRNNYAFSTETIPKGVYVLKISNGLEVDAKRLIVQ